MFRIHIKRFGETEKKKLNLKPLTILVYIVIAVIVIMLFIQLSFAFESFIRNNRYNELVANNTDAWLMLQ